MRTKYLVLDNLSRFGNTEGIIVFPEFEEHERMARKHGGKEHVVSAGFCQVGIGEYDEMIYSCYGESQSLGIKARPDIDSDMLRRLFQD